jgi:cardiolipin synthase
MRNFTLANLLTFVRLALAPVAVRLILAREFRLALAVFFIAAVTDGLDGLAARRFGVVTRLGAYLDPIADKLLLSASFLALGACGAVPWWLVILIFARDLLILSMVGAALLFTAYRSFPPSVWGKISTFFQVFAAVAALVAGAFPGVRLSLDPFFWAAAAATVWSGGGYVWRGVNMARNRAPAPQS